MSGSSAHAAAARRARFIRARIRISTFVLRVFNRGPPALLRRADGSGCPKRTAEDPALSIPARQPKVRTAVRAEAMRSPRRAKWGHRRIFPKTHSKRIESLYQQVAQIPDWAAVRLRSDKIGLFCCETRLPNLA